jgi:hypothetical protein
MNDHIHGTDSPLLKAAEVYKREECARPFKDDLEIHLLTGYVYSTPDYFIMGRPVDRFGDPEKIIDPTYPFPRDQWNCWHIYLMAGDVTKCWSREPIVFPWVSWEKRNRLRFYQMWEIRRRIEPKFSMGDQG